MEVTQHVHHESTKQVHSLQITLLENSQIGLENNTDLISGKYEGGLKVWECSIDLILFLQSLESIPSPLLELGCGHGLPGIICAKAGSQVVLQDFNIEVIQHVTINNAIKNNVFESCRFVYGPWGDYSHLGQFEMVISSETIYNPEYYPAFLQAIRTCGAKVAYIACKNYYFGVGGGAEMFMNAAKEEGWICEIVKRIEEIASIRYIIKLTKDWENPAFN